MNEPASEPPQCATKSISNSPGETPFGERSHCDTFSHSQDWSPSIARFCMSTNRTQEAINRCRTHGEQQLTHIRFQLQPTMAQHGFKQLRKYRLESLAADPIRRFSDHNQRLFDRFAIDSSRARRRSVSARCVLVQKSHGMLSVVPSDSHKLVQNFGFGTLTRLSVAFPQSVH